MRRRGRASHALAASLLSAAVRVGAGGAPIVSGRGEADFAVAPLTFVPSYSNRGFRQEVDGDRIRVTVSAEGAWTHAGFDAALLPKACGPVDLFARAAASSARTQAEAVSRVLQAIASGIAYRQGADLPEAPEQVLERREAHCVGMSNLAVAALSALAIPARVARGLLWSAHRAAPVPHRWIEVYYPDAGWVFSDPTESANYVSVYHVVLTPPSDPDPGYDPAVASRLGLSLAGVDDGVVAVDLRPGKSAGLGERQVLRAQFGASVVGRIRPASAASVRLLGAGRVWEQEVGKGSAFSFPGLPAGSYALEARVGDSIERYDVRLSDAEVVQVEVRLK